MFFISYAAGNPPVEVPMITTFAISNLRDLPINNLVLDLAPCFS